MTRFARAVRVVLFLPILAALVGFVPASQTTPHPAPPTPAYSPPPSEPSPFSRPDAFCVSETNRFDAVAPADPRVRAHPVAVVWLTKGDGTAGEQEETDAVQTFAHLIDECGGIGGRPFDLHTVHESADPTADCADAVIRFHPDVVVSGTEPTGVVLHRPRRADGPRDRVRHVERAAHGFRWATRGHRIE